jgi:sRNA-binding carbon storage regulator CsrA
MPKEYEKFKAEWAVVLKEINQGLDDMHKDAQIVAQTSGVMAEGAKEIGGRVQVLKAGGLQGTEIGAFMGDKDIKVMMQGQTDMMATLEKEIKRVEALHSGPWVKSKARFWILRKELEAEIAARKKQFSTKTGVGNKSLPDMVKLLAEIDKVKNAQFVTWDAFVPEDIAQHRKELNFKIKDEINKAKDVHLSEYQAMMQEQGLNVRVMRGNLGKAKTLYTSILAEVAKGETAPKDKKAAELLAAQQNAAKLNKDLVKIVDPYEKAPGDQWLRTQMAESKDKATIDTGIKSFIELKNRANTAVVKIAKAKV